MNVAPAPAKTGEASYRIHRDEDGWWMISTYDERSGWWPWSLDGRRTCFRTQLGARLHLWRRLGGNTRLVDINGKVARVYHARLF